MHNRSKLFEVIKVIVPLVGIAVILVLFSSSGDTGGRGKSLSIADNKARLEQKQNTTEAIDLVNDPWPITGKVVADPMDGDLSRYVKIYKKEKVQPGYILVSLSGPEKIWLMNLNGHILREWNGIDAERAYLLKDGSILVLHGSKFRLNTKPWRLLKRGMVRYSWDGKPIWKFVQDDFIHHHASILDNGNIITLRKVDVGKEYVDKVKQELRRISGIRGDSIIEVNPQGKIVWRWDSWKHFDVNFCGQKSCEARTSRKMMNNKERKFFKKLRDWTHGNTASVIPPNKWYDAGDKRFKPGNIIFMPRNFWTIYIIDKDTKEIVWSYTGDYKGGIGAAHDPHMIPKGYPGAGNILVLDNGSGERHPKESYVLEINPVTKKVVWVYDKGKEFFCRTMGNVQRLKNGNTQITNDMTFTILEVTKDGETVWRFDSPFPTSRSIRYPISYVEPLLKRN